VRNISARVRHHSAQPAAAEGAALAGRLVGYQFDLPHGVSPAAALAAVGGTADGTPGGAGVAAAAMPILAAMYAKADGTCACVGYVDDPGHVHRLTLVTVSMATERPAHLRQAERTETVHRC